jgi:hypothetical protein
MMRAGSPAQPPAPADAALARGVPSIETGAAKPLVSHSTCRPAVEISRSRRRREGIDCRSTEASFNSRRNDAAKGLFWPAGPSSAVCPGAVE